MHRHALRDDQWVKIKDCLPGREGHVGGNAADNRLFVDAVIYRYRTGIPWRDLPERYGEPTFADAILDRLVHNAYRLALDGASMRKIKAAETETSDPTATAQETDGAAPQKPAKGGKR